MISELNGEYWDKILFEMFVQFYGHKGYNNPQNQLDFIYSYCGYSI